LEISGLALGQRVLVPLFGAHAYYQCTGFGCGQADGIICRKAGKVTRTVQVAPWAFRVPRRRQTHQLALLVQLLGLLCTAQDLDVVKLTALFVAKRGKSFMTALSQREARNFQCGICSLHFVPVLQFFLWMKSPRRFPLREAG
jgi:hypothetical protein